MVLRCEKFEIGGQMGGKVVGTRLTLQGLRLNSGRTCKRGQRILTYV